jgi:membrane protease YdiL (CAAX protease family)
MPRARLGDGNVCGRNRIVDIKPLTKYFLLTYAMSWTCFIGVAVLSHEPASTSLTLVAIQQVLVLLGAITPSLVALWLTANAGPPGQTQKLISGIGKWKVGVQWYVFAAGFIIGTKLLVALLYKFITGSWPAFGQQAWYTMLVAVLFSTWVQAGEEIGWRGFALPRMSARFGLPLSTVLLGVVWACWHLPLFFVRDASLFGQSFPLYLIQVTALSVIIGWLYWQTKGSLLLTMLLHAAINNTKDIVPSAVPGATNLFALSHSLVAWLTVVVLWIFATYCLISMRQVKILE